MAYYLFPMTGDANRLEFDLLVTESKDTGNTAGFFGGVFTDNYVYSLGLRGGGQKIRGIYSKNGGLAGGSFAGAGSPTEENVGLNRPIHYVIEMDGDRHKTTITFLDDAGAEQTRSFSQSALSEPDGSTPTEFYYGFALANVSVTITNMVYTSAEGVVLYDQNDCYYPKGTAPSASEVTAAASDTREYIDVTWKGTVPEDDGTYVVEMQKDGGQWTELTDDVTGFSVSPMRFRQGKAEVISFVFVANWVRNPLEESRTNYAEMTSPVSVLGALAKPVVSITAECGRYHT